MANLKTFSIYINHYVIQLDSNDEEELFEEYMRFLIRFCTYGGAFGYGCDEMAYLAQQYVYPFYDNGNNYAWVDKLEQVRVLAGKPLFQFAVCDMVLMTDDPDKAFDKLLFYWRSYSSLFLKDDKESITWFYRECEKILDREIVDGNTIQKSIKKRQSVFNVEYAISMVESAFGANITGRNNVKDIKNCLLSLDKMLNFRLKNDIDFVAQKLLEYKKNKKFEDLYMLFGYPMIFYCNGTNNLDKFVYLNDTDSWFRMHLK